MIDTYKIILFPHGTIFEKTHISYFRMSGYFTFPHGESNSWRGLEYGVGFNKTFYERLTNVCDLLVLRNKLDVC
jgi:hypothetical protein